MPFIRKLFLPLLLVALFLSNFNLVYAQVGESTKTVVYEQESLSKDIRQLKLQYRGELEEYRGLENLYLIAKKQYYKLNTLASLEDVVQKTQAAMSSRDKVLKTYLRLLRLELLSQPGIELPEKKAAEQSLLAAVQKIEQHQQQFEETLDKPQLSQVAEEFKTLINQIEEASYQTLTLVSIGELQTIHDKAILLRSDMELEIATAGGALKSTERKRSFDETDRVLNNLEPKFDSVEKEYSKASATKYKRVYATIGKELSSIHSSLSQALAFLRELLKI